AVRQAEYRGDQKIINDSFAIGSDGFLLLTNMHCIDLILPQKPVTTF
ncbi:MAG: hypothetical protein ACJAUP_000516, partial [Cellvibrionaceae bacterium]